MSLTSKWFGFGHDALYDEGFRAYNSGNFEEAIEAFQACLGQTSDPSRANLCRIHIGQSQSQLGAANLTAGNFEAASQNFRQALEQFPTYADLHLSLAKALRGLGHASEARQELQKALERNPDYIDAILLDGVLQYESGADESGFPRFQRAIELDAGVENDRYRFALQCHEEGDRTRAVANFAALGSSSAQHAKTHLEVAQDFAQQRMFEESAQEYEKALGVAPGYADAHCKYGEVLLELDQLEKAEAQFRQALEINPRYTEAHVQLGIALRRLRRNEEAKAAFANAVKLDPKHPIAIEELSRAPR